MSITSKDKIVEEVWQEKWNNSSASGLMDHIFSEKKLRSYPESEICSCSFTTERKS